MKIGRVLCALALSIGLSIGAQAKTIPLGTLSNGDTPVFGDTIGAKKSFTDMITFTLTSVADLSGGFFATGISNFALTLVGSGTTFSGTPAGVFTFGQYSFAGLTPGSYTIDITGTTKKTSGTYLSAFGVVSAVPEADAWLMLIAGLALVGFQLRRKQHSLPLLPID